MAAPALRFGFTVDHGFLPPSCHLHPSMAWGFETRLGDPARYPGADAAQTPSPRSLPPPAALAHLPDHRAAEPLSRGTAPPSKVFHDRRSLILPPCSLARRRPHTGCRDIAGRRRGQQSSRSPHPNGAGRWSRAMTQAGWRSSTVISRRSPNPRSRRHDPSARAFPIPRLGIPHCGKRRQPGRRQ